MTESEYGIFHYNCIFVLFFPDTGCLAVIGYLKQFKYCC